jgi:hypothetical protein
MRELTFTSALANGMDDDTLFKELKKQITRATRVSGYIEYDEVQSWVAEIDPLLGQIEAIVKAGRAPVAIQLLEHFFDRMESGLANIDDSNGEGGGLYARAREVHFEACCRARPDPVALARSLFGRETKSEFDFFSDAAATYEDVLGAPGLAEYHRLADEAWSGVTFAPSGQMVAADIDFSRRYRLSAILDWFAEREGDLDARIAVRAKDLSSPYRYLEIAQLCMDAGRDDGALKWAEDGIWQFEDSPDDRLTCFTADLYRRTGRQAEADALLWRAFDHSASLQLYGHLKAAVGANAAALATVRDKAVTLMRAQLDKSNVGQRRRWQSPRDILVQFAMREDMLALAWETVSTHGCQEGLLMSLAEASEISHPAEALTAYAGRVEQRARVGGREAYADACQIIQRMARISERVGEREAHDRWLAELKLRHKAKRTFMALLNDPGNSDRP